MASDRRTFLAATLSATAAGVVPVPVLVLAPVGEVPSTIDEFDTLRRRWPTLALGAGYDPAAEPCAARLARTGGLARGFRATMTAAPGSLRPQ
ncbi:hypothetical protein ACFSL4_24890 [Streptomyces caeni]|uniref:Uncharacterized protein n=1 Tax=Streptomyces caeni TaxID=2307231 RepID=A0ABW4IWL6_9ACTN